MDFTFQQHFGLCMVVKRRVYIDLYELHWRKKEKLALKEEKKHTLYYHLFYVIVSSVDVLVVKFRSASHRMGKKSFYQPPGMN